MLRRAAVGRTVDKYMMSPFAFAGEKYANDFFFAIGRRGRLVGILQSSPVVASKALMFLSWKSYMRGYWLARCKCKMIKDHLV